jgi:hypothetical protein
LANARCYGCIRGRGWHAFVLRWEELCPERAAFAGQLSAFALKRLPAQNAAYMPISLTTEEVKYLKELVAAGERGRTIAARRRRDGLKRLVALGYVVSRPMSMHTVHYLITDEGRKALGDVQSY